LNNRKAVILAAVIAVLEALRNQPDKQHLLIYDSFYPINNNNNGVVDILGQNDVFIGSESGKLSFYVISS
jgi:hypothetical protein